MSQDTKANVCSLFLCCFVSCGTVFSAAVLATSFFFWQFFILWLLFLQLLHHFSIFNKHSKLLWSFSTTFEAVSIKSLFSKHHIFIGVGSLHVKCLCAFFVAAQYAFKFGKGHLLFPLNNHGCKRIILTGKAFNTLAISNASLITSSASRKAVADLSVCNM